MILKEIQKYKFYDIFPSFDMLFVIYFMVKWVIKYCGQQFNKELPYFLDRGNVVKTYWVMLLKQAWVHNKLRL